MSRARRLLRDRRGQSTLEFMLILAAFVSMAGVLGLMWHAASDGTLLALASEAASHGLDGGIVRALKDAVGF